MNLFNKKEIVVRINLATGETAMEAIGFNGNGCREATKPFEDALGVVTDRTMKTTTWNVNAIESQAQHLKEANS